MQTLVILVEGAADDADAVRAVFQRAGYDVAAVADAADAVRAARKHVPQAIVVAAAGPAARSLRLARRLRRHRCTARVPIVVLDGPISGEDARALGALGATGHLQRPCPAAALLAEVQYLVHRARPDARTRVDALLAGAAG